MINYNLETAQNNVGGKYNLVLIAAQRARELSKGDNPKFASDNGSVITAIREVEQGHIGTEYLERLRRR